MPKEFRVGKWKEKLISMFLYVPIATHENYSFFVIKNANKHNFGVFIKYLIEKKNVKGVSIHQSHIISSFLRLILSAFNRENNYIIIRLSIKLV